MRSPLGSCTTNVWVWVPWFGYATRTSPLGTEYAFWSNLISSAMTVRFGLAGTVAVELEPPPPPHAARASAGTTTKTTGYGRMAGANATVRRGRATSADSIEWRG